MAKKKKHTVTVELEFVKEFMDDDDLHYYQLENGHVVAPEISEAWTEREWSDVRFHTDNGITEMP